MNAVNNSADRLLYSGSIIRQGEVTAVVTATGARTYFGRTTELVERAQPKYTSKRSSLAS